jgi:hypothetical protein
MESNVGIGRSPTKVAKYTQSANTITAKLIPSEPRWPHHSRKSFATAPVLASAIKGIGIALVCANSPASAFGLLLAIQICARLTNGS